MSNGEDEGQDHRQQSGEKGGQKGGQKDARHGKGSGNHRAEREDVARGTTDSPLVGADDGCDRFRPCDVRILSDGWSRLESVRFDYRHRNGQWERQTREVYHRGHGAAILLYNLERQSVVLVRQFRYPAHATTGRGFLLEVPAGMVEGEDPAATVIAETEQETGYRIGKPEFLYSAYVSPGSITERLHFFTAPYDVDQRVGNGGGLADEGEDIEVVEMSLSGALRGVSSGQIEDMKTILLLQHAALKVFGKHAS